MTKQSCIIKSTIQYSKFWSYQNLTNQRVWKLFSALFKYVCIGFHKTISFTEF